MATRKPTEAESAAAAKAETAPVRIRLATEDDAADVLAVYAPYISTPATFEEAAPSLDEFRERMTAICANYPYLVVEQDGYVIGFAYAHAQAKRVAYGWNAELSVYLTPESHGRGLGTALYAALIELVRLQGVKTAYALVTMPNAASEHLHATFGFHLMGVQCNAGYTCGVWHDVAWYVLPLADFEADPQPIVPFPALAAQQPNAVQDVLDRANAALRP